ncbi:MAG: type 2 glycerol-3-phosphate oxidase [Metamycoplasmataceae bacterium]
MKIFDIAIIGGGIIGGVISYELSKYKLKQVVFEKNPILADETTRGNSGAIHGGFDPETDKLEARLNVLGNKLWSTKIFKDLEFPKVKIDSLVVAFNKEEEKHLQILYDRGLANKVSKEALKIISHEEIMKKEPNINPKVTKGLICSSSWAIDPVAATKAFFGVSENNGTKIMRNSDVTNIKYIIDKNNERKNYFEITINNKDKFYSKNIINAAGHYADTIAEIAGYPDFKQKTRRGEYIILSRSERNKINSIIFMVPTIHGKGIIVAPMLDGNVLVGPTAEENVAKEDTRVVTRAKYDLIKKIGSNLVPSLDFEEVVMTIAGSRPIDIATNDFVIQYARNNNKFINAAGMQSPAIASAPAIALEVAKLLKKNGTKLVKNPLFKGKYKVMY